MRHMSCVLVVIAFGLSGPAVQAASGPLKVYILAGQPNMQGKARVSTIERLDMTEDGKEMYKDMMKVKLRSLEPYLKEATLPKKVFPKKVVN